MIDESTPLHIRFMLCMTALEGLLLSNPGEDYLRLEFAEKITFLIGDSEEWHIVIILDHRMQIVCPLGEKQRQE